MSTILQIKRGTGANNPTNGTLQDGELGYNKDTKQLHIGSNSGGTLKDVNLSDYNNLANKPQLFSGNYNDLNGKPSLAQIATSGNYEDLIDKPDCVIYGQLDINPFPGIYTNTNIDLIQDIGIFFYNAGDPDSLQGTLPTGLTQSNHFRLIVTKLGDKTIQELTADNGQSFIRSYNNKQWSVWQESNILDSGQLIGSIFWILYTDGLLKIFGNGEMPDYTALNLNTIPWYKYRSKITKLSIENGITSIGNYCFAFFDKLQFFQTSNSLQTINSYAFNGCYELKYINMSNQITNISTSAFFNCTALSDIYYYDSIEEPNKLTVLNGNDDFNNANKHTGKIYNSNLNTIVLTQQQPTYKTGSCGPDATWKFFKDTGLLEISGQGTIDSNPWGSNSNIKTLKINFGINEISKDIFGYSTNLTEVILPSSLNIIGEYAFHKCTSLKSIHIPSGVHTIKTAAFQSCDNLVIINMPNNASLTGPSVFNDTDLDQINYYLATKPEDIKGTISVGNDRFTQEQEYADYGILYVERYNISLKVR